MRARVEKVDVLGWNKSYPVVGKSAPNYGIESEAVADELSICTVAMPTHIFGVLVLGGPCGTFSLM